MHHIIFEENDTYDVAILIKNAAFRKKDLQENYIDESSLPTNAFIGLSLKYNEDNKAPASLRREHLKSVLKAADSLKVKILYVCDTEYFKTLSGKAVAEPYSGYIMDCVIEGFEHIGVVLGLNHQRLFYNPILKEKILRGISSIEQHLSGIYITPGSDIIHSASYPLSINDMRDAYKQLHQYPELVCDIETFSLMLHKAHLGSVAFAWDKNNGIAMPIDLHQLSPDALEIIPGVKNQQHTRYKHSPLRRGILRNFLLTYKGKLTYHNANFDVKILIFTLFAYENPLDYTGILEGLEVLTKNFDDIKLISFLATNSTARVNLSLKELAQEFAGNYAVESITDITRIPLMELLEYNLVDCLSTWYVKEKYHQTMIDDDQQEIYNEILLPSVKNILQIELTGMPLNIDKVRSARNKLSTIKKDIINRLFSLPEVISFQEQLRMEACIKANLLLKKKVKAIDEFQDVFFNPNSSTQIGKLLFDNLKLECTEYTPTGEPATGNKVLAEVLHTATTQAQKDILQLLMELSDVSIILNNFLKNFLTKSIRKADGLYYLHGNHNIGGTVSGRLSCSDPNMQQIPSTGTPYAKLIKNCFEPPSGWLLMGADFASLEDRISALTTKDPNKLKVYTDGYDGHCLRAFYYFGEQMKGIVDTVTSINSIALKYPELRQDSKAPTFLLTYGGKAYGLEKTVGLTKEDALKIETNYHKMYKVSDDWVAQKVNQATIDGYVTCAFGLRVRTPILKQVYLGKQSTPYEAQSEARTAGNALGQSYGLLNARAGIEFQERVLASEYKTMIRPIAQIHDSLYFLVKDHLACVTWFNKNLIECMEWQELPEIQHPTVKLGGEVELFYPSWAYSTPIPNNTSKAQIYNIAKNLIKDT